MEHSAPFNGYLFLMNLDKMRFMFEYQNYIDFLQDELLRRTSANRAYSLRAFAKALGLSSGELSEILRGKRKLSLKSAVKISKSLGLNSIETKHLISLIGNEINEKSLSDKEIKSVNEAQLSIDQFTVISEWYHFAILNLADCKNFNWSYSYISKKLNIKPFEVKIAIEKMIHVGLIKKSYDKNGEVRLKVSEDFVMPQSGIPSTAIRKYHKQILNKAIEALEIQSVDERDITGIGLSLNKIDIKSFKKDISAFQDFLIEKYSKGKKERAYQLEMALFALSEDET
jgi:uncharacterized protein (TIGR02147 family)